MCRRKICLLLVGLFLFAVGSVKAQNLVIPQDGFVLSGIDSVTIEKGSFEKVHVWVLRSKSYQGDPVSMGISSSLPEGVQINFASSRGKFDLCEATISVSPNAAEGTHYVIVSGTMHFKTKGIPIKLHITKKSEALTSEVALSSSIK